MKKFEITNVETLAFDEQIVTMKAIDATLKLHIHDQTQFASIHDIGKVVPIDVDYSDNKPAKKVAAKKVAVKKVAKLPVTTPAE